ncbi:MAG TPA: flagellar filament capping protein FliD [Bryobacteraceae bacterium]|nr:flagellar filament capping protein FliD [Bryobacteraceae bacterium]
MSSSINSLLSATPTTTYFNGTSSYSADLNNVINRALQIASLPEALLSNQLTELQAQSSALQSLGNVFSNLQSAINNLDSATGTSSFGATVSDQTVAKAHVAAGVLPGSYTINVVNLGSRTTAMSDDGLPRVVDPSAGGISASTSYTLTVDGSTFNIKPASTSLNDLVTAINNSGAPVQATVVNIGGSGSPDYRLSIQGADYGSDAIQLNDGSQDVMNTLSPGSPVTYQVNGQPATPISSGSRTVTLSPGLTVDLLDTGQTEITVAQNQTSVATALNSFVVSYNAVVDQLAQSHGQNANALAGQSVVLSLEQTLHQLANFGAGAGGGQLSSLADIGLTFDKQGHLNFDSDAFNSASDNSISAVMSFLGSASSGTGFIGQATAAVKSVLDSSTGQLTGAENNINDQITKTNSKISDEQNHISALQQSLTQQMALADATIAGLQAQATSVNQYFQAMALNTLNMTGGVGGG